MDAYLLGIDGEAALEAVGGDVRYGAVLTDKTGLIAFDGEVSEVAYKRAVLGGDLWVAGDQIANPAWLPFVPCWPHRCQRTRAYEGFALLSPLSDQSCADLIQTCVEEMPDAVRDESICAAMVSGGTDADDWDVRVLLQIAADDRETFTALSVWSVLALPASGLFRNVVRSRSLALIAA